MVKNIQIGTTKLLKTLWSLLNRKRKLQIRFLLLTMILSAFAEIFTIASVFPFLTVLTNPEQVKNIFVLKVIFNFLNISESQNYILLVSLMFILTACSSAIIRLGNLWLSTNIAASIGTDLSFESYKRTIYQPYLYHTSKNSSEVIANSTKNVEVTVSAINKALDLIASSIISFLILLFLLILDFNVAITSISIFSISYLILSRTVRNTLYGNSKKVAKAINLQVKVIQEGLGAIRDVIIGNNHEIYTNNYLEVDIPLRKLQAKSQFLGLFPRYAIEALGLIVITLIALSISSQTNNNSIIISTLGTMALGFQRLLPAFQQIYSNWAGIKSDSTCIKNIIEMIKQPIPNIIKDKSQREIVFNKEIKLVNISFKYPSNPKKIFKSINLSIKAGERIGIIGETGGGKSTLMDLLIGLIPADSGKFLIDGIDISKSVNKDFMISWRKSIAHVSQSIFLSDATIRENIAFGKNPSEIDEKLVRSCSKKANIDKFIKSCPNGYKTIIGENGVRLSGGQKQRIGIARALYNQKKILFLDEATSALDNDTEKRIMDTIDKLDKNLTIIMIAHRITTLSKFDRILKIENGNIS
tara:strand:- start:3147 stop:4901 length:1755 start_codon:yes stop_codon:yes gene_type:complete